MRVDDVEGVGSPQASPAQVSKKQRALPKTAKRWQQIKKRGEGFSEEEQASNRALNFNTPETPQSPSEQMLQPSVIGYGRKRSIDCM